MNQTLVYFTGHSNKMKGNLQLSKENGVNINNVFLKNVYYSFNRDCTDVIRIDRRVRPTLFLQHV